MSFSAPRISVIIPALDEEDRISGAVASALAAGGEVIVADGGSGDGTAVCAAAAGARVVAAPPGRGPQMNAGAAVAAGDLLVFLHADTRLGAEAGDVLRRSFSRPDIDAATFRLRFDADHPLLRFYAWCARLESPFTRFGDACIVVRKGLFREVGGFPDWPLLEDVDLLRRLRRRTKVRTLPCDAVTSARRFRERGVVRAQAVNAGLLMLFFAGVRPGRIAALYRRRRSPAGPGTPFAS